MIASDYSSNPDYRASIRQARNRGLLLTGIALITLIAGIILIGNVTHALLIAALTVVGWFVVQLAGILYLRTGPKHPAVGLAVAAGITTGLVILLITHQSAGFEDAILIAGTWLLCGALAEIARGKRWSKTITADGTSGHIVRTLATFTGYDGTPLISFLTGGVLVGVSAWLIDLLPWLTPFAMLLHIAASLGISVNSNR